ncbi:MAG: hypothetical protein HY262_06010 [Chloroflexi bacterium]|nr:hypothetical protein [Chloroflexota bacterium]
MTLASHWADADRRDHRTDAERAAAAAPARSRRAARPPIARDPDRGPGATGLTDRGEPPRADPAEDGPPAAAFAGVTQPGRRAPVVLVIVVGVAVLGLGIVTRQGAPTTSRPANGVDVSSAVAPIAPSATIGPGPATGPIGAPPSLDAAAQPHPTYAAVPIDFGTIQLRPAGAAPVRVSIDLPPGWNRLTDGMVVRSGGAGVPLSMGAWRPAHVFTYPCRWSAADYADASLLDTAEGAAQALSSWWGQDPGMPPLSNSGIAPLASRPAQTTLAGYPAWYVEVLIPSGLDLGQCDGRQLILWDAANGDVRYALGPSEVNRLWVVDPGSGPIVIDAGLPLEASGSQRAELQWVVDSILIEP